MAYPRADVAAIAYDPVFDLIRQYRLSRQKRKFSER